MSTAPRYYTTADLAAELGVVPKTIRKKARKLGIGLEVGGRGGWRYTEADRAKLIESMRPAAPVTPRRRRRAA